MNQLSILEPLRIAVLPPKTHFTLDISKRVCCILSVIHTKISFYHHVKT